MERIEMGRVNVKDVDGPITPYLGVIDSEGNFVFINFRFYQNLHSNVLSVLHTSFFGFIHPDDLEKCKTAMVSSLLSKKKHTVELRLKNGNHKWVRWQIANLEKGENHPDRFLLTGADMVCEGPIKKNMLLREHYYETILEKLGVGILFQDESGKVIIANQRTAEIFNTSLEEIYQHNTFDQLWKASETNGNLVPFENSPPMIALRSGQTQANVLSSLPKGGGELCHFAIHSYPVSDNDQSSPHLVISSITDISEEKKLRALCEQREALFTSFMNHSPSFAWIVDEKENVIYANKGLLDYLGADESVLNRNIYDILPKTIADAGHEKHTWVLENKLSHSSILKSAQKDGSEEVFHVTTFPAKGAYPEKLVCGQAWNITESYHAKALLKKNNERLLYLSRASSEAIWDWNMQTGQIFRNQALLKLIGYHEEKPSGLSWWYNQIHPKDRKKVQDKIEHILGLKENAWEQEYRFLCLDGSYMSVLDRGFVVYENSIPIRMVGSLQDVTEIKQLEAKLISEKLKKQQQIAEAILQAQEQERTRIGHELHDNVNQILFTCKLYLDLIKTADQAEKEIKVQTQEFIVLAIEEIRKLSKDLVSPPLQEIGLISCINRLIEELEVVNPFDMQFFFEDRDKIESMNYNIKMTLFRITQEQIKNIIKYSQANNVSLQLSVIQKKVHLLIEDDGIGFDARQARRGIGLSNIYERTNLYNGNVDLKTQPGQGCKIKIVIPFF